MNVLHTRASARDDEVLELTIRGIVLGALITVIFTASNVYLGLKVGLTFSSAIPAAVISMAVLKAFTRSRSGILENNMVQTQASAAGTLSSVIFILPGLLMVGHWHGFPYLETFGICAAGGLLGVVFTIPLRHALVVESDLPYPEGVAAAEILQVGERSMQAANQDSQDTASAKPIEASGVGDIVTGGVLSALVAFATSGLKVLSDGASLWATAGAAVFRLPFGFSLALLGAGYLIGIFAGIATLIGVVLAWGVAVPILTTHYGIPAGMSAIAFANKVWSNDVRFIGAGIIGVAAIWTLITLIGPVGRGMRSVLTQHRQSRSGTAATVSRLERDMPLKWIIAIMMVVVLVLTVTFALFLHGVPLDAKGRWTLIGFGVLFAFIFGFMISAACGYMAGLIGSSSSPISGIGVVGTILIAVLLTLTASQTGLLTSPETTQLAVAFALFSTSPVVAVAAIANDNMQDLKTGQLVGATPWRQQVALVIGVLVGSAVIPPILNLLYHAFGFVGNVPRASMDASQVLSAPQATLMASIAQGIFNHNLNWTMLKIGALVGIVFIVFDTMLKRRYGGAQLPVLAVGIGVYLPPAVSIPLFVGAFLAWGIERHLRKRAAAAGQPYEQFAEIPNRRAVLLASGLIVGESLWGVALAAVIGASGKDEPFAIVGSSFASTADLLSYVVFAGVCWFVVRRIIRAAGIPTA